MHSNFPHHPRTKMAIAMLSPAVGTSSALLCESTTPNRNRPRVYRRLRLSNGPKRCRPRSFERVAPLLAHRLTSSVGVRRCIATARHGACQSVGFYPSDGTVRGGLARVAAGSYDRTVRTVSLRLLRSVKKRQRERRRRAVAVSSTDETCGALCVSSPGWERERWCVRARTSFLVATGGSKLPAEVQAVGHCAFFVSPLRPHGALLSVRVTLYTGCTDTRALSLSLSPSSIPPADPTPIPVESDRLRPSRVSRKRPRRRGRDLCPVTCDGTRSHTLMLLRR